MNFSALSLTESQIPDCAFYFRPRREGHHNVVAYTKLPRELFRIAAYNTGQVFVAGQTKLAKEKIKRDKDGYVLDAESKRVPVVLQYSSFEQLKDKAKAIVEAHAKEASQRWNA